MWSDLLSLYDVRSSFVKQAWTEYCLNEVSHRFQKVSTKVVMTTHDQLSLLQLYCCVNYYVDLISLTIICDMSSKKVSEPPNVNIGKVSRTLPKVNFAKFLFIHLIDYLPIKE